MAFDYHDTIGRIISKAQVVAERYAILQQSREAAEARVKELEALTRKQETELQRLREEVFYLKHASVIQPDRDQIESTRAMISGLVREIDRCIADLSD